MILKADYGMSTGIIKTILRLMGWVYIFIEQFVSYPNDGNILGMDIDEDFQKMSDPPI